MRKNIVILFSILFSILFVDTLFAQIQNELSLGISTGFSISNTRPNQGKYDTQYNPTVELFDNRLLDLGYNIEILGRVPLFKKRFYTEIGLSSHGFSMNYQTKGSVGPIKNLDRNMLFRYSTLSLCLFKPLINAGKMSYAVGVGAKWMGRHYTPYDRKSPNSPRESGYFDYGELRTLNDSIRQVYSVDSWFYKQTPTLIANLSLNADWQINSKSKVFLKLSFDYIINNEFGTFYFYILDIKKHPIIDYERVSTSGVKFRSSNLHTLTNLGFLFSLH